VRIIVAALVLSVLWSCANDDTAYGVLRGPYVVPHDGPVSSFTYRTDEDGDERFF
jgi:hypothetical protein